MCLSESTLDRLIRYHALSFAESKVFAPVLAKGLSAKSFHVQSESTCSEHEHLAHAVLNLTVTDQMVNGYGTMHGGAIATLVDICTAIVLIGYDKPDGPWRYSVSHSVQATYHNAASVYVLCIVVATFSSNIDTPMQWNCA